MSVSVRYLDRNLLKNVLHHVDTHNRLMEEKEMWSHKRKRRRDESSSEEEEDRSSRGRKSYGRMRSDSVKDSRAIVKQKAADGKWSHSGFMELYPDDFLDKQSMDEMSDSDGEEREKKRKKRKKRQRESSGDESHQHRTAGSRKHHVPEKYRQDSARNNGFQTIKRDQDNDRRGRFDRSISPRRHQQDSKRLPNHIRDENNSSETGKNNRHRTMDGKRGRDRDRRSNEIVSPKRHELSNRTGRYPAKDPGVNSSHDNKEPRGRYRRSPRKHEHSRGMKSPSDGGLMKGVGQNEKGTGLGSPWKQKHSGNEEMVPEGRSHRKHELTRSIEGPVDVSVVKGSGQTEERAGLGSPGKLKNPGSEERVPEERFSDLEDEVFGLSSIRAKLQKREREMRRRMEKRIERYGEKKGGRHKKKHKKKKSRGKKRKEGDVER